MKNVSFLEGVLLALLLAVFASVSFSILSGVFTTTFSLSALLTLLATIYMIYLLARTNEKVGRISVAVVWIVSCLVLEFLHPALWLKLVALASLVWVVRCLYCYTSVICALGDLVLGAIAVLAAMWAVIETNSLFLATWSFFLVQAIFVRIPNSVLNLGIDCAETNEDVDRFNKAHVAAQGAVQKLTTTI